MTPRLTAGWGRSSPVAPPAQPRSRPLPASGGRLYAVMPRTADAFIPAAHQGHSYGSGDRVAAPGAPPRTGGGGHGPCGTQGMRAVHTASFRLSPRADKIKWSSRANQMVSHSKPDRGAPTIRLHPLADAHVAKLSLRGPLLSHPVDLNVLAGTARGPLASSG